jgi:hypothetical protein
LGSSGRLTSGVDVGLEVGAGVGLVAGALGAEVVETGRGLAAADWTASGTALDRDLDTGALRVGAAEGVGRAVVGLAVAGDEEGVGDAEAGVEPSATGAWLAFRAAPAPGIRNPKTATVARPAIHNSATPGTGRQPTRREAPRCCTSSRR